MKHNGIIAVVFIVGCATGGVAAQLVVPRARAGTSPTRWEYQCAPVTDTLNKLGADGWELVSMVSYGTYGRLSFPGYVGATTYTLYAKRPLP